MANELEPLITLGGTCVKDFQNAIFGHFGTFSIKSGMRGYWSGGEMNLGLLYYVWNCGYGLRNGLQGV